jgi:hypothetical protein
LDTLWRIHGARKPQRQLVSSASSLLYVLSLLLLPHQFESSCLYAAVAAVARVDAHSIASPAKQLSTLSMAQATTTTTTTSTSILILRPRPYLTHGASIFINGHK